jgi:uncharacterized membrane protein
MLVAVFDGEDTAFEGLSALKDLHRDGDISLYSAAVIAKNKDGRIEVKQAAESGPVGAAVGLLTGSLIGLAGGPVGMTVGASVGGLAGLVFDVSRGGVDMTFLDDVSKALTAGKFAVLAEIGETWTTPVDTRLQRIGGQVFRRLRSEVVADQLVREREALEANLKALNEDLKQAASDNRAAIQQDIARVKKQIEAIQGQAKARLNQVKAESEAHVKSLHDQARAATGRTKTRIEKRIADAQAELEMRSKKLSKAWALTKEAFNA